MAHNNSKFKSEAVRAESRARPRPSGNAERREQGEDLRARGARQSGENGMRFGAGQDGSWGNRPTHATLVDGSLQDRGIGHGDRGGGREQLGHHCIVNIVFS